MIVIAQITDTHIVAPGKLAYRVVDTAAHLATAVQYLASPPVPIHAVMITGDLTDNGLPEEYQHFKKLIAPLTMPIFPIPGNHDHASHFREAFAQLSFVQESEDWCYALEVGGLRLVMLNSTIAGEPFGLITDERLAWLDRVLGEKPLQPAILALHHPPFLTGIAHMDVQNCKNSDALASVLSRHPQVLATICGHAHRSISTTFAGRPAYIAPSVAHSVTLDFSPDAKPAFHMEPPGILLHSWTPDGSVYGHLVTHLVFPGSYPGPYPFFDAAGKLIE